MLRVAPRAGVPLPPDGQTAVVLESPGMNFQIVQRGSTSSWLCQNAAASESCTRSLDGCVATGCQLFVPQLP
jgi:hypothetical protein